MLTMKYIDCKEKLMIKIVHTCHYKSNMKNYSATENKKDVIQLQTRNLYNKRMMVISHRCYREITQ